MADRQMQKIGEIEGSVYYWAEPGLFEKPGIHVWNGQKRIHISLDRVINMETELEILCVDHDVPSWIGERACEALGYRP